jgi:glucose/arabinose dehydrogenase
MPPLNSSRVAAVAFFVGASFTAIAFSQTNPIPKGEEIKLTQVATINTGTDGTPQDLVSSNDSTGRIFITTRNGDIRILSGGSILSTPFLNMSAAGINIYTGGEGGLLGIAFSPNYATDGKFYTIDTEPYTSSPAADFSSPEIAPTTSVTPNNQVLLREWTVNPSNANLANTTSRVLIRINHPESNHQGGSLRFGPDGNLYMGLGDGGGGNDFNGSASSTTDGHNNTIGNGQDTTVPFGKILRINPNPSAGAGFTTSANGQYSIPNSNPFISGAGGNMKEIYAYGLRNPYRIDFDSATGTFYVGDVGQSNREEVDTISNGGNYGWPFMEGTRDNSADAQRTKPGGFISIAPIAEYTHSDGEAIIGGDIYRKTGGGVLDGQYLFGDLGGVSNNTIGRLFYTASTGGPIKEFTYDPTGLTPSANLYGFGTGPTGDMYAFFSNGQILQITNVPEPATLILLPATIALLAKRRHK